MRLANELITPHDSKVSEKERGELLTRKREVADNLNLGEVVERFSANFIELNCLLEWGNIYCD